MKTLVYSFDNPVPGDLVIVQYEAPGGGKTSVKHKIRGGRLQAVTDDDGNIVSTTAIPADQAKDIASELARLINKDWMPECTKATAKHDTGQLVVKCTDLVDNVRFSHEVNGVGGTMVSVMEF